jgi:L-aspartate oxidase
MAFPRRWLTRFSPKQTPQLFTDVLVIGSGIAGFRAALEVPPDQQVLVVTKDRVQLSNSAWAQGGIAAVLAPGDRFEDHVEDTLIAGAGLCDRAVVEKMVRDGPERIADLRRYGAQFDADLGREGGHRCARIVHARGDATGAEVMRAIIAEAQQRPNVTVWERTFTIDLLTHDDACVGALVVRRKQDRLLIWAKQTVLASGGCGLVYRETSNPPVATGDGMAAAYRAGAQLRDMEFMQFHPTLLYMAGSARHLISEAVRGAGAYLRDKHGHRFMPDEDPRAELATRDVVARAIVRAMARTQHPNVYLDLSHIKHLDVRQHFPGIAKVCAEFGLDIATDLVPVRPGAHYMVGGVTVDVEGRTTLPGLWAAGEVTSSGLHGANRLASNSLLEGLVFGALCGRNAAEQARRQPDRFLVPPIEAASPPDNSGLLDITDMANSLRSLMMRNMGITRDHHGLLEAEERVAFWCGSVLRRELQTRAGWELQNLLTVTRLMIGSALPRTESRGVHHRSDFPERDDGKWLRHIVCPRTLPDAGGAASGSKPPLAESNYPGICRVQ